VLGVSKGSGIVQCQSKKRKGMGRWGAGSTRSVLHETGLLRMQPEAHHVSTAWEQAPHSLAWEA
jgi:hypothetical protein